MADQRGATDQFQDIQRTRQELLVTEYLAEDLLKNWEKIFNTKTFNPELAFAELPAYYQARKNLWYNGWVTLCGNPGDGKSSMAEHLFLNFVRGPEQFPTDRSYSYERRDNSHLKLHYKENSLPDEGRALYEKVIVNSPEEYLTKVDPSRPQVVIIDDIFGRGAFSWSKLERWRPFLDELMAKLTNTRPNTMVIVCVNKAHLEKAPEEVSQLEWFRHGVMIDFTGLHKPNKLEKQEMMNKNVCHGFRGLTTLELSEAGYSYAHDNCGLLYRLYSQVKSFQMEGYSFFQSPWGYCEKAIDKVYRFDRILYYTLAVAVTLDGTLDLSKSRLDEYDVRSQHVITDLIPLLDVPVDVDLAKMRFAAKLLNGFFLRPVDQYKWVMTHDKIFQLSAASLCRKIAGKFLEMASKDFIMNFIRVGSIIGETNELAVNILPAHYESLAQRMILELISGDMKEVMKLGVFGDEGFVKKLFEQMNTMATTGTVINLKDSVLGRSLFYWACYYGQGPVVKEILELESELKLQSEDWFRKEMEWGLQAACAMHSPSSALAVKCLLDAGVPVDAREKYEGQDGLYVFGKEMLYFMKLGAKPIHIAARRGHPSSIKHLIVKGASVKETTNDGWTPLHRAATRKHGDAAKAIRVLLDNKADVNAETLSDRKPLHEAFTSGCLKTIEALVDAGADINGLMDDGRSFHSMAAMNRQQDVAEYLFRKDVKLRNIHAQDSHSALHYAIANRDLDFVELLLRKNANVNHTAITGLAPLHLACLLGEKKIVEQLLRNGAQVNETAFDRRTPLHYAAMQGQFEIIELLLENGAKTELLTSNNEAAVVLSARAKHKMTTWLLLKEGMELECTSDMGDYSMPMMMRDFMFMH